MLLLNRKPELFYLNKRQLHSFYWRWKAHPVYLKMCDFFGATLIDRTCTIPSGLDFTIIDPIEQLSFTDEPFGAICKKRAADILKYSEDRIIRVLWSGGIDSTVALIALFDLLESNGKVEQLKVLLSDESIREFPSFFESHIRESLSFEKITTTIYDHINFEEIIVTGEHGDQLFGSDKLKYLVQTQEAFRPYKEIIEVVIARKLGTDKYSKAIVEMLEPQLAHAPYRLGSLYDLLWWINFSMKWQNVSMRLLAGLDRPAADLETGIFHFFKSTAFQNWSASNPNKKIKNSWKSYKYVAKEYIYEFHQDEEYLKNKEKEQSLKEVIVRK